MNRNVEAKEMAKDEIAEIETGTMALVVLKKRMRPIVTELFKW